MGMIVYHLFYLLSYFNISAHDMQNMPWLMLAYIVQIIFITLVGVSLAISQQKNALQGNSPRVFLRRQWRRGLFVLVCAFCISFITAFLAPEMPVRFGILHLIGVGILLFSFIAQRKYFALAIAAVIFAITFLRKSFLTANFLAYPFGFFAKNVPSIDYFPMFPWLACIALGIFLGHFAYKNGKRNFSFPDVSKRSLLAPILFLGQHSLLMYLLNVPVIIFLLWILNFLNFNFAR